MRRTITTFFATLLFMAAAMGGGVSIAQADFLPGDHLLGSVCATLNPCTSPFVCSGPIGSQTCVSQETAANNGGVALGSSCAQTACASGLYCVQGVCRATPTDQAAEQGDVMSKIFDMVMTKIMTLFAFLVGLAATMLDNAVYYTVINMGHFINGLPALQTTWTTFRDVANILLIFGFLAVGISTILNAEWYGGGTEMLPMLLVAAVFVNFSLFFAEAIVDAGNLVATQFSIQINDGVSPPTISTNSGVIGSAVSTASASYSGEIISTKLMDQFGLASIYGVTNDKNMAAKLFKSGAPWYVGFMSILLFIIAAFVMFSLALILVFRFVALIFLLIIAPVGFAGWAVPMLKKHSDKWWSALIQQTITAPILMMMLYLALKVILDPSFLVGFGLSGQANTNALVGYVGGANLPGFGSFLLSFLVGMGLLLAVTVVAKNLGAAGADTATKIAGKATLGMTAWGMRRTVGRLSNHAARTMRTNKTLRNINTRTGGVLTKTFDRGAKANFDLRGIKTLKGLPGGGSIQMGEVHEGGYRDDVAANIKAHEAEVKNIKNAYDERGAVPTKLEAAAIERTKTEHEGADAANKTAQAAAVAATAQMEQYAAEVARLEAEKKKDKYFEASGGQATLDAAKTNLESSRADLAAKKVVVSTANIALDTALKAREKAEKAPETHAEEKKTAVEDYANVIEKGVFSKNPLQGIMNLSYGPDGSSAAKKIRKSLEKKDVKGEFTDAMGKYMDSYMKEKTAKDNVKKENENKGNVSADGQTA